MVRICEEKIRNEEIIDVIKLNFDGKRAKNSGREWE